MKMCVTVWEQNNFIYALALHLWFAVYEALLKAV